MTVLGAMLSRLVRPFSGAETAPVEARVRKEKVHDKITLLLLGSGNEEAMRGSSIEDVKYATLGSPCDTTR
jgi:hypothetical protein